MHGRDEAGGRDGEDQYLSIRQDLFPVGPDHHRHPLGGRDTEARMRVAPLNEVEIEQRLPQVDGRENATISVEPIDVVDELDLPSRQRFVRVRGGFGAEATDGGSGLHRLRSVDSDESYAKAVSSIER